MPRSRRDCCSRRLAGLTRPSTSTTTRSPPLCPSGQVRKAKCKLKRDQDGKYFVSRGESTNGDFDLTVNILDWQGFKQDYTFYLGVQDPNFFVTASYGVFSNVYEIPGTPPGAVGAGGAVFRKGGEMLRLGVYLAPSSDLSRGVAFAGGMECKYPRGEGP